MSAPIEKEKFIEIRKLRKKLRQIDHLESLDRDLTKEETQKVIKKLDIRSKLLEYLSQISEGNELLEDASTSNLSVESSFSDITANDNSAINKSEIDLEPPITAEVNGEGDTEAICDEQSLPEVASKATMETTPDQTQTPPVPVKRRKQEQTLKQQETEQKNVPVTSQKKLKAGKSEDQKRIEELQQWRNISFDVRTLEGHEDSVCTVACDGQIAISGGKDTAVKVWNCATCAEIRNLGGHSGTVTAIVLLDEQHSTIIGREYNLNDTDRIVVSGSLDCSLRLWSIDTGSTLKSIYTFNPVTTIGYIGGAGLIVSGSDGGKLELWDPVSGETVHSVLAFEDRVTCIHVVEDSIHCSCSDGTIKIYTVRDRTLCTMYESENVQSVTRGSLILRNILSLQVSRDKIFFGDNGVNIKVLEWRAGVIHKLSQHCFEFGSTTALSALSDLMLAAGYDLDSGLGYINVRSLPSENYLATLNDGSTEKMTCMAATRCQQGLRIITGGNQVKVWTQVKGRQRTNAGVVHTTYNLRYTQNAESSASESELDTDNELSDSEQENDNTKHRKLDTFQEVETDKGWMSWCTVL
ncbi:unnamed protein product [Owenia fusiformis]|uniref:Uncharacterized protein n=1 Tax=Owenia fusiformis TaxID=6347 RepID=A0A8S4MZW5_OWEFU|nr:unnamed protein product [Owenia fusiformis]